MHMLQLSFVLLKLKMVQVGVVTVEVDKLIIQIAFYNISADAAEVDNIDLDLAIGDIIAVDGADIVDVSTAGKTTVFVNV